MGEYAIRASDGLEVKIGTCEDMYYLRFEDRYKVLHKANNVDPASDEEALTLRFRLPFPDEDDVPIGQYKDHTRGYRLYRSSGEGQSRIHEDFTDESTVGDPGIIQMTHASGLLVNVPCYHGHKLPDAGKDMRVFWNGKSWSMELYQLALRKDTDGEARVFPIVHCRWCGHAWRYQWSNVIEYLHGEMKDRLAQYAKAGMEAELASLKGAA